MCISPQRAAVFALLAVLAAGCGGAGSSPAPGHTQAALGDRPPMAVTEVPRRPAFIDTVPAPPPAEYAKGRPVTVNTTHPSFFTGETALSNGVYYLVLPNSNLFGYYSYLPDSRYIYHFDIGYWFVIDANDGKGGLYAYDFSSSHWWYTGAQYPFPYIYDFSLNAFLYYYPGAQGHYTTNPRYFYNFGTNSIVTLPAATAPTVGYLGSTGGGFSGALNGTTTSPLVVAISGAHVASGPNPNVGYGSVVVNNGVNITAVRRQPHAVHPLPAGPPPDGPLDTQEYHRLRSLLHQAPPGAAPSALRRTRALGTTIGATYSFWVNSFGIGTSGSSYALEAATLRAVPNDGNIWVANTLTSLTQADYTAIANDFENAWTSDMTHFGTPLYTVTSPGAAVNYQACDASGNVLTGVTAPAIIPPVDSKIDVLVVDPAALGSGVGGYFSSINYVPQLAWNCLLGPPSNLTQATLPRSNEAPMIYTGYFTTNGATYEDGEDLVRGTAHEFQHLINFVHHDVLNPPGLNGEDAWINEGMSMLAQDLAVQQMYPGTSNDVDDALFHANLYLAATENVSVTGFTSVNPSTNAQTYNCSACYGAEYLFQRYLYDRFGGNTYLHNMLSSSSVSYANLQAATGVDPTQALSDFAIALAASNTGTTSDPRYVFTGLNLHATLTDQFGHQRTLAGPSPLAIGPATYNDLLGSFLYLQGTSALQGQTVTVKSPNANFALNAGVVQK